MNTLLITGTDTEVGKTALTTILASYWYKHREGKSLGLMKLLQTKKHTLLLIGQLKIK